jgi:putative hydrolase of the HAD superfamily
MNRPASRAHAGQVPIRAVSFDVGGTLIQPWPSVGHVYAQVAARNGFPGISPLVLNQRFGRAWRALKRFNHLRSQWSRLVDDTFRGLVTPSLAKTFFPELYEHFSKAEAWRVFDDVVPALKSLQALGTKLCVISNWDERLRPLLRLLDLDRFFETVVVSCDRGHPKPSPFIFQEAARSLRLPPDSILHVGDSFAMDVRGARAAGFRAVHLQRDGAKRGKQAIGSLADLPRFVLATH